MPLLKYRNTTKLRAYQSGKRLVAHYTLTAGMENLAQNDES